MRHKNPYEPPNSDPSSNSAQEYQEPPVDWAGLILVFSIFVSVIILGFILSYYIS